VSIWQSWLSTYLYCILYTHELILYGSVAVYFILFYNSTPGWAIAHFENVRSLLLTCKKCDFKMRTFFAHPLFSKELLCDRTLCRTFEKCKKVWSHIRTFLKSDKMCNRTIALFQRATKNAIAQSLFWNERMCKNVRKKYKFWNHTFLHFNKIAQLFFQKGRMCKKSMIWNQHFFCIFLHIRAFWKSDCAITLFLHFFKEWQKVQLHILTFLKSDKMCDRTLAHF